MMKLKASRSSSDLVGCPPPPVPPNADDQPAEEKRLLSELRALRVEVEVKDRQLEKLRQETSQTIQHVRVEEHGRLVFALKSLRQRLHKEKVAELKQQKQLLLAQALDKKGPGSNPDAGTQVDEPGTATKRMTVLQEDEDAFDDQDEKSSLELLGDECKTIDHKDEEDNGNETGLVFHNLKSNLPITWHSKDRFRSLPLSDLNSTLSIMDPIQEDKEEYDWFEERRQLLEDREDLLGKVQTLETEKAKLETELQEVRDQNELMEFRILEIDQCQVPHQADRGTNTDPWWNLETSPHFVVPRKRSYTLSLPEFNEDNLQDVRAKLQSWVDDAQKSPLPEGAANVLQAIGFLDVLKQISMLQIKENHTRNEEKAKEKVHLLDGTVKVVVEKHQHPGLSLSSSIDSASEVSDAVSQGGETGYSSDDSIDAEELYQMNPISGEFSSPYTSFDGFHFFPNKSVADNAPQSLPLFGDHKVPLIIEHVSEQDESGFEDKLQAMRHKCNDFCWKPVEMLQRIKDLEAEEIKAKEAMRVQQEKVDRLQSDNAILNEKCLELEEAENDARFREQNVQKQLDLASEADNSLRQSLSEMVEKDLLSKKQIVGLEQERDTLRLEATQLLNLINTYKIFPKTVETSQDVLISDEIVPGNKGKFPQSDSGKPLEKESTFAHAFYSRSDVLNASDAPLSTVNKCLISNSISLSDEQTISKNLISEIDLSPLCEQCIVSCYSHTTAPDKMCARILLDENVSLHKLISDKNQEIKNKETEYNLKIEALKCDHDETVACLEDKMHSAQKHERELREQAETILETKEILESNYKAACDEMLLEKTSLLEQITMLHKEKSQITNNVKLMAKSGFISVSEDIYEDGIGSLLESAKLKGINPNKKIRELENHLSLLCQEAEESTKRLPCPEDLVGEEFVLGTEDNLLKKIQDLTRSSARLKQRIFELEKKEMAYKETLQEADKIMADVEKSYKERIEELETVEEKLRARIVQLEQSEKRLRQTLRNSNRNSEVAKFGELLDRLLETEASEQKLKDRIHDLEQKEREQKQYVTKLEKEKQTLESELQEQEEFMQTINQLKRTEKDLRLQIEGLETSESALQETLFQADAILAEREHKLQDKLEVLEAEMENLQKVNSQLNVSEKELKTMLEDAYGNLEQLQAKLRLTGDVFLEMPKCRCPNRNGVQAAEGSANDVSILVSLSGLLADGSHPVRLQQMSDILEKNSEMELQVSEVQASNDQLRQQVLNLETQILQLSSKPNKDPTEVNANHFLELNLELLARNSQIQSLQDKIKLLETGNTAAELLTLSFHADELGELKEKINSISRCIQDCNCCNCINCRPLLHDMESQVFLLDEIISGSCPPDSGETNQGGEKVSEDNMNGSRQNKTEGLILKNQKIAPSGTNNKDHPNRTPSRKAQNEDLPNLSKQLQNLQNQISNLQDELAEKKKLLEAKDQQQETLNARIESHEIQLEAKVTEMTNLQNNFKSLQEENSVFREKARKAELSEQLTRENLSRTKQDLLISNRQVQQLEQRLSQTAKQLKCIEQSNEEINNLRQKIHDIETELQKKRESERKLHAENVHLHHKVEGQRERINSLQIIKKDYKIIMSKYDVLEKQKKILDQAVVPLKNKITQLTQKCKEKEHLVSHLTKQNHHRKSSIPAAKSPKDKVHDVNNSNNENSRAFDEIPEIPLSPDMNFSSLSSSSNETSDSSFESSSDNFSQKPMMLTPRSRIPRYTALSSPLNSPRSQQPANVTKNASIEEMSPDNRQRPDFNKFLTSPRLKSPIHRMASPRKSPNHNLSPPAHFHVTRQVGCDSLLVAWMPPAIIPESNLDDPNAISGYQVFVNGALHQKVRSPDRTKALLNGLDLSGPIEISICTVTQSGLQSTKSTTRFSTPTANRLPGSVNSNETVRIIQKPSQQKGTVKCNYSPNRNSSNPFFELSLKTGDTVTVFGERQANGFFYGEANGQRGLIPAHVLVLETGQKKIETSSHNY